MNTKLTTMLLGAALPFASAKNARSEQGQNRQNRL